MGLVMKVDEGILTIDRRVRRMISSDEQLGVRNKEYENKLQG